MTDQIMETLTNEEHERLLLMSEHAIAPPLSPAAQAVLDAWNNEWSKGSFCHDQRSIAAALRAAADQVVPPERKECECFTNEAIRLNRMTVRSHFLAIAAELEGSTISEIN